MYGNISTQRQLIHIKHLCVPDTLLSVSRTWHFVFMSSVLLNQPCSSSFSSLPLIRSIHTNQPSCIAAESTKDCQQLNVFFVFYFLSLCSQVYSCKSPHYMVYAEKVCFLQLKKITSRLSAGRKCSTEAESSLFHRESVCS